MGTGGSSIESVEAADLDGDGRTDLVFGTDNAGTGGSPSVAVLWNRLDGREH